MRHIKRISLRCGHFSSAIAVVVFVVARMGVTDRA
jgi:hypothetical protein